MFRILLDQNFDHRIYRGLLHRIPGLVCETTEGLGLKSHRDDQILAFAASESRIIFPHDERTFGLFAYERLARGEVMSGLVVVPDSIPIGKAIDDLELLIACSNESELNRKVLRLPL